MKTIGLLTLSLLAGCATFPEAQLDFNTAVYKDMKMVEGRIINLEKRVFVKEIAEQEKKAALEKKPVK